MARWADLSGSEARQRLVWRGVAEADAERLWRAHERGERWATEQVDRILGNRPR